LSAEPDDPSTPKRPTNKKALVGILGGILVVALAIGTVLFINRDDKPDPTASGSPLTCWDGSSDDCPEFAGSRAVQYAFAPPDPDKCHTTGTRVSYGVLYDEYCSVTGTTNPPHLQLYQDVESAKARFVGDHRYKNNGTWKNVDGDVVGTMFTRSGYASAYCYNDIPVCLHARSKSHMQEFGTLSAPQIQRVAAWLSTHPVTDPTAEWDLSAAKRAFPAADGSEPLKCSVSDEEFDYLLGAYEGYKCSWSDSSVYIGRWITAQDAAQAYRGSNRTETEEPWMVDGVERGVLFTRDFRDIKVWCYVDAPYCILIWDAQDASIIDRIAPLTADQAAEFFRNIETAEQAFPAADGIKPLTCKKTSTDLGPTSEAAEQFTCRWPSDGAHKVIVTRWQTAQDGPAAWRTYLTRDSVSQIAEEEQPWTVDNVERGTTFVTDEIQVWCYADAPYCIETRDPGSRDVLWNRVVPLTADQAASLGKP
ncbi:MAG: hypothetical protein FWH11_13155, partial [Micrococcales bacterium]|nr:hypothetical protein [Micrococcales bacterium]